MNNLEDITDLYLKNRVSGLFRTAIRAPMRELQKTMIIDLVDRLVEQAKRSIVIRGCFISKFNGLNVQTFDYGNKLGMAVSLQIKKDRHGSMIFAVAQKYERLLADVISQRDFMEMIISKSRSIVTARKKLRQMVKL